jgi:hypothetical protein
MYPVRLTIQDDTGLFYETSDTVVVSDPEFSPVPFFGDASNYDRMNSALWSTCEDQGDLRYFLNSETRHRDSPFDGYSFLKDSTYADFSLSFKVRTGENWEANPSPEYRIIWGFIDEENYTSMQMRNRRTRLATYKDGNRNNFDRSVIEGIPDDLYHEVIVSRAGETVTIFVDDETFLTVQDPLLAVEGRIGFGSNDDAVFFDDVKVSRMPVSIDKKIDSESPEDFNLGQNYPNPFNMSTEIPFTVSAPAPVRIDVYNTNGQHIITLVDKNLAAGHHRILWNGRDFQGDIVPSGIYNYRIISKRVALTKSMVLCK